MATVQETEMRKSRGQTIANVESNVRRLDQNEYRVRSQSGSGEYRIFSTESGWTCSCPDATYRQIKCKHIFAVELSLEIRRRIENSKRIVPLDYQACLSCGSQSIVKDGLLHNQSGDIQRFTCKQCGKRFTKNLGFEHMRAKPEAITMAMQLYFSGESLRNTKKALALQGVKVSHVAILKWIRKYVGLMDRYLSDIQPNLGDKWRADEVYIKFSGRQNYLFAAMDDETRYWIAQQVSEKKGVSDITPMLREAKAHAHKSPTTFITDGAPNFHQAYRREFAHSHPSDKRPKAVHIAEIQMAGVVHNNKMERMNGEVRDREKTMRGLKNTDTPILKGLQIYHNFIREHEGLGGKTPAEAAGITVEGQNKWLTLIQNAKHLQSVNTEEFTGL